MYLHKKTFLIISCVMVLSLPVEQLQAATTSRTQNTAKTGILAQATTKHWLIAGGFFATAALTVFAIWKWRQKSRITLSNQHTPAKVTSNDLVVPRPASIAGDFLDPKGLPTAGPEQLQGICRAIYEDGKIFNGCATIETFPVAACYREVIDNLRAALQNHKYSPNYIEQTIKKLFKNMELSKNKALIRQWTGYADYRICRTCSVCQ